MLFQHYVCYMYVDIDVDCVHVRIQNSLARHISPCYIAIAHSTHKRQPHVKYADVQKCTHAYLLALRCTG